MEKPKRLWDDIHAPENLFRAESFEYIVLLPLEECVARLQALRQNKDVLSPRYYVNAVYDEQELTATINRMSRASSVWAVIHGEAHSDNELYIKLKTGVAPDILQMPLIVFVLFIFFWLTFRDNLIMVLLGMILEVAFVLVTFLGAERMKQQLIEDVRKLFDIPAVDHEKAK